MSSEHKLLLICIKKKNCNEKFNVRSCATVQDIKSTNKLKYVSDFTIKLIYQNTEKGI